MKQIANNNSVVQVAMQILAPILDNAGNWLGRVINDGIDKIVDSLEPKKE